jgi:cyclohexyl-isocyanide hydratase
MPFRLGFIVFPKITQLDFTGPLQVLTRLPDAEVHIVAKSMEPVQSDGALRIPPTTIFADCPQLDMLCAPGGAGVADAMMDEETVAFVRRQAPGARYVTSVCTGAFILGAAGVLKGKRATTHWGYTELLPMVGAMHEKARVVRDGNVITAGGVTSGIDFGFTILAEIAGEEAAEAAQLGLEYDPAPPFNSGSPDIATPRAKAIVRPFYSKMVGIYRERLATLA